VALIEPADVERLFRAVVSALAERDPTRLTAPLQVAEVYQQIVPYRTHRAQLGFDTHQDYEGAILGLLAGIGGYVDLEPAEARDVLAAEAASSNPDPSLVRDFAGARVLLRANRVREVLDAKTAFAPPPPFPPSPMLQSATGGAPDVANPVEPRHDMNEPGGSPFALEADERAASDAPTSTPPPIADAGIACPQCDRPLPVDRTVVFCPYCGTPVGVLVCTRCGDQLRPDWRFCPRCGHVTDA
jgi:RNA polymerase subunit RPABC4/transcription elongation factor Spt4